MSRHPRLFVVVSVAPQLRLRLALEKAGCLALGAWHHAALAFELPYPHNSAFILSPSFQTADCSVVAVLVASLSLVVVLHCRHSCRLLASSTPKILFSQIHASILHCRSRHHPRHLSWSRPTCREVDCRVCCCDVLLCAVFTNLLIFWRKKNASHKFYKMRENAP